MTARKAILVVAIIGVGLALSILSVSAQRSSRDDAPELPELYRVPEFAFTDSTGRPFGLEDLNGNVWVASLIFTSCSGPCPVMSRHMAQLQETFAESPNVHFVSITVDPEVDTPEVLTKYAERFAADTERWHLLTGPIEAVNELAVEGFKLGSGGEPIFHSTRFVLVDGSGFVRGYYEGAEPGSLLELSRDISALSDDL